MKKILKSKKPLKKSTIQTLTGLSILFLASALSLSACATPIRTEEKIPPLTENVEQNESLSPFESYSHKIPEDTKNKIIAIYEELENLTPDEAIKLVEKSFFITDEFTKPESRAEFLETLKTEKLNKDFGNEPVTFVLEENLELKQKSPIYISVTEEKFDYIGISYNTESIWGYLNGNLFEDSQDTFVYNGLVVDFETTKNYDGQENLSLGYVYANIGDFVVSVYSYQNGNDFCIEFSKLFKIKDISFEDYAKEYGVDDPSLIGWTDSILENSKSKLSSEEKEFEK